MSWKIWLVDITIASLAVAGAQLTVLQDAPGEWRVWARAVGFGALAQVIPETLTFLGALRAKLGTGAVE